MDKIDTDWKTTKLKSLAKLFKPFNRDWAPLTSSGVVWTENIWYVFRVKNRFQITRAVRCSLYLCEGGTISHLPTC